MSGEAGVAFFEIGEGCLGTDGGSWGLRGKDKCREAEWNEGRDQRVFKFDIHFNVCGRVDIALNGLS